MIPIMQPTVSYIKKWGESLHILESSSLTPRFPPWNPNRQCCQVSHRKGRSLGMGLLQFLPCSLGIGLVWYQPFFSTFFSHTHPLSRHKQAHAHTHTHPHRLNAVITIFEVSRCVPGLSLNTQHGGCRMHIALILILKSSSNSPYKWVERLFLIAPVWIRPYDLMDELMAFYASLGLAA